MLPVTVVISESQFAFLMEVYFDPIIYFSMVYVSIWFFLSVNFQLIFTRLLPMDYQRPLISTHTPSSHMVSLQVLLFQSCTNTMICTSIIPIHEPYFSHIWYWILTYLFKTNLIILSNAITKFISPNCHARKTSTTPVGFLHILQLRITQVTQLSGFYFSKKELLWMFSFNKFSLHITSPRVLSWQMHLD